MTIPVDVDDSGMTQALLLTLVADLAYGRNYSSKVSFSALSLGSGVGLDLRSFANGLSKSAEVVPCGGDVR